MVYIICEKINELNETPPPPQTQVVSTSFEFNINRLFDSLIERSMYHALIK